MVAPDDSSFGVLQEPIGNGEVLNEMFNIVQGPPGTGKTRTIAQACVDCFDEHEKILVTAETRHATQAIAQAVEKSAYHCLIPTAGFQEVCEAFVAQVSS